MRQRLFGTERVAVEVVGHELPVDAADVFPPADHLADEPLGGLERRSALPPSPLRAGDHVARIEQLHVERLREPRVVEPGLARPDRVLIAAEERQAVREKIVEGGPGRGRRDGPVERGEAARMVGEPDIHQIDHAAGDGVGREGDRCGKHAGASLAEGPAILGVEVPLAARGLAIVHQHAKLLPQRAVEVFEPQLLAAAGVGGELVAGGEEVAIGADLERDPGLGRRRAERLLHPPFARLHDDQPLRLPACLRQPAETRCQRRGERGRLVLAGGRREFGVIH